MQWVVNRSIFRLVTGEHCQFNNVPVFRADLHSVVCVVQKGQKGGFGLRAERISWMRSSSWIGTTYSVEQGTGKVDKYLGRV